MSCCRQAGVCGVLLVLILIAAVCPVQAQLLGQVTTARTLVPGANDIGGYLGLLDHYTTVFGQYRRGLSSNLDFGLQFGLVDPDAPGADAGVIFGGDLKYNVMSSGYDPFDLALDLRSSFFDVSHLSVFSIGGGILMSRDYAISPGGVLTPYGGVVMRLDHRSVDASFRTNVLSAALRADNNGTDNTDLNIGGVAGVKWEMSDLIDALGEVILDDEWGLVLGLNFKL